MSSSDETIEEMEKRVADYYGKYAKRRNAEIYVPIQKNWLIDDVRYNDGTNFPPEALTDPSVNKFIQENRYAGGRPAYRSEEFKKSLASGGFFDGYYWPEYFANNLTHTEKLPQGAPPESSNHVQYHPKTQEVRNRVYF